MSARKYPDAYRRGKRQAAADIQRNTVNGICNKKAIRAIARDDRKELNWLKKTIKKGTYTDSRKPMDAGTLRVLESTASTHEGRLAVFSKII